VRIRDERPGDIIGIHALLDQAFSGEPVGQLVDDLRSEDDLLLSLVAEVDGQIAGHIGFSPVAIAPCLVRAVQLSPLAVAEPHRRQGIGAELVRSGIDRCRVLDIDAILVLGDPHYYQRFGFDPSLAARLRSRWSGPHLMALSLTNRTLSDCTFCSLAPAFERM
jgi:putative acetyltransferase